MDQESDRLYKNYVSTHAGAGRTITLAEVDGRGSFYRTVLDRHLPADRASRVLDIGCGHGALLYHLRRRGFTNVRGIDISIEQVQLAAQLGITDVQQGDIADYLTEHQGSFEVITAFDVLEHLRRPELLAICDRVAAALSPGGLFITQVPNASSPIGGRIRYGDMTHEMSFTPTSIHQLFRTCGLVPQYVGEVRPIVHGATSFARFVIWLLLRSILQLFVAAETGQSRGLVLSQNMIAVAIKPQVQVPLNSD